MKNSTNLSRVTLSKHTCLDHGLLMSCNIYYKNDDAFVYCPSVAIDWPSIVNIIEHQYDVEFVFEDETQAIVFKLKFPS